MLAGLPATVGFRAAEDTLTYRLPHDAVRDLFARPEGLAYVVRRLDAFDQRRLDGPRTPDTAQRPVGSLLRGPALVCPPDTTVQEAARRAAVEGSPPVATAGSSPMPTCGRAWSRPASPSPRRSGRS